MYESYIIFPVKSIQCKKHLRIIGRWRIYLSGNNEVSGIILYVFLTFYFSQLI